MYLSKLVTVQSPRSIRSSFVVTISRPPTSILIYQNYKPFFEHAAPRLSNKLPHSFCEPHPHPGLSPSHYPIQFGSTLSSTPLSPSITPSLFHSRLKTPLPQVFSTMDFSINNQWTDLTDSGLTVFLLLIGFVLVLVLGYKRGTLSIHL